MLHPRVRHLHQLVAVAAERVLAEVVLEHLQHRLRLGELLLRRAQVLGQRVEIERQVPEPIAEVLVGGDVERDVVVVDRIVDHPVPSCVAVAQIGLAGERAVRDVHQAVGHRDADLHAFGLVPPLFLVRPPIAGADVLAGGRDPVASRRVFPERKAAESRNGFGHPRVVEVNRVLASGAQRLREVDEDRVQLARVLQRGVPEKNLFDLQIRIEIHLDACVVLQHPEADRVLAADELLDGIDADVEVVGEQVVVGAVRAVLAAQHISAGRGG